MKYKVFVDDIRLAPTEYNKVFRDAAKNKRYRV